MQISVGMLVALWTAFGAQFVGALIYVVRLEGKINGQQIEINNLKDQHSDLKNSLVRIEAKLDAALASRRLNSLS